MTVLSTAVDDADQMRSVDRTRRSLASPLPLTDPSSGSSSASSAGSAPIWKGRLRQPLSTSRCVDQSVSAGRASPVAADRPTLLATGLRLPTSDSSPATNDSVSASNSRHGGANLKSSVLSNDLNTFLQSLPKSGNCPLCSKEFGGLKKHARSCFAKNRPPQWDPFFNFSDSFFESSSEDTDLLSDYEIDESAQYRPTWLADLDEFTATRRSKFNILHLNINSVRSKSVEVSNILSLSNFDIVIFEESKLGPDDVANWLSPPQFNLIRRDRCRRGGGILVFINKRHKLLASTIHADYESIVLKLKVDNQTASFIVSYCPRFGHPGYIDHLEDLLLAVDSVGPTFIIGDLNHNLLTRRGKPLNDLLSIHNFKNLNNSVTRPCSASLIDVIFSNSQTLVCDSSTLECPFSDHSFLLCSLGQLKVSRTKSLDNCVRARCLNERTLDAIKSELAGYSFGPFNSLNDINLIWCSFANQLLALIDAHAPMKQLRRRKIEQPWVDNELLKLMLKRDQLHSRIRSTPAHERGNDPRWIAFRELRNRCKSLYRSKMKEFFQDKTSGHFKNSKKFWKLYRSVISTKSSSNSSSISAVKDPSSGVTCTEPQQVCDAFNRHFSNYVLPSDVTHDCAYDRINTNFHRLKREGRLRIQREFTFGDFTCSEIASELANIDPSSSAGVSAIPTKVLRHCSAELAPPIHEIFQQIRRLAQIPDEWKSAIVTPLFKKKGDQSDCNNYRSISVLPATAKVFEKLICNRLLAHFSSNNLLAIDQHGFRGNHSCETALHSLLDDWKSHLDGNSKVLSVFIDFTKAFDLIDRELLLLKLFHYGVSSEIILLLRNYFSCRSQFVRLGNLFSEKVSVSIGLPQGSILGPTLFLFFINDLSLSVDELKVVLFADDTTVYCEDVTLEAVVKKLASKFTQILDWVESNRMSINWRKTTAMLLTRNQDPTPKSFSLANHELELVNDFKLLGVIINRNLDFTSHIESVKKQVNIRLFAIKKIYYLSASVKLQFLKTFVLPFFDYCLTLAVYYSRANLTQLEKLYNFSLFKLLQINLKYCSIDEQVRMLRAFHIQPFRARLYYRFGMFVHGVFHRRTLSSFSSRLTARTAKYDLRSKRRYVMPITKTNFGNRRLLTTFVRSVDSIWQNAINLSKKLFAESLTSNFDVYYPKFSKLFNFSN